jgi:Na+/melibiose symporter-like transporter
MEVRAESLPLSKQILYALGQFGWSLASYSVANLVNYFYIPPEQAEGAVFPPFVFQGAVIGIFTIVGLINFGGRIFDGVTDPLIAGLSDRSNARIGKRRLFMLASALPFALLSVLVFVPPASEPGTANVVWLIVTVFLFYLAMTAYVVPYTALISELGHSVKERLQLSTIISITWALGFAVGNQIYAVQGALESSMDSVAAFQTAVAVFAGLALLFMLVPVVFINERRYSESHVSKEKSFQALAGIFRNRNFLFFAASDFMYWLALTFIQTGISYYVTLLMGLPVSFASLLATVLFLVSFVFYVPVNLIARRVGKKRLVLWAFIVFSVVFGMIMVLGNLPVSGIFQGIALVILAAFPISVFGILPNAIVADLAEADGIASGNYKAGVFFGARALMMKLGISFANLIFPSLLTLGRSVENPTGVRLTGLFALVFSLAGLFLFLQYREQEVLSILKQKEETRT